jgi:hypothetical protein
LKDKYLRDIPSLNSLHEQEIFYGTHLIRNGKIITEPVIPFKEPTIGDYHKRHFEYINFIINFNTISNEVDNQFGIMVNKSRINTNHVNQKIIKLINTLKNEIRQKFEQDFNEKSAKIPPSATLTDDKANPVDPPKINQSTVGSNTTVKDSLSVTTSGSDNLRLDGILDINVDILPSDQQDTSREQTKKVRKPLQQSEKDVVIGRQGSCDKITGVKFSKFIRYEIDHIDGTPSNNEQTNLQAITPDLHSIKTNDLSTYNEIVANPHDYNIHIASAHLGSPITFNGLTEDKQKILVRIRKDLEKLVS